MTNGVDLEYFHALPDNDARHLVFVGVLDYLPNVDGIEWFVHHMLPLLRRRLAGTTLSIVGHHPTRRVRDLNNQEGVNVVGPVDDVRDYIQQSPATIAPLRIARGIQNKVLEAMACARGTGVFLGPMSRTDDHAADRAGYAGVSCCWLSANVGNRTAS